MAYHSEFQSSPGLWATGSPFLAELSSAGTIFLAMELRHLRYYVAVAEELNFTKAAARLRLAQPALSRQVADLEDELGVDLLSRTSHGVRLTEEGKLFLTEARVVLGQVDESVRKVRALARGELANCRWA